MNQNTTAGPSLADLTGNLNGPAGRAACGCGGQAGACACDHGHGHGASQSDMTAGSRPDPSRASAPSAPSAVHDAAFSAEYAVDGMTCGNCVRHVSEALESLPGVRSVTAELVAGGTSTVRVTSEAPLAQAAVREALDDAGYALHA
ncbi:hypothetical protein GCM10027416_02510 [Okibacterium endophyticum]